MTERMTMTDKTLDAIEHMLDRLDAENGQLVLSKHDGKWVVGCFFGVEAPDSPMAGGAAHGLGPDLTAAVLQAAGQMGWKPEGDGEPQPIDVGFLSLPAETQAELTEVPRYLTTYDDTGRMFARWRIHTDVATLADAPIEATNAIRDASLVVGDVGGAQRILKSRFTDLDTHSVDEVLSLLRSRAEAVAPADELVDDRRPRVDGTPCPWRGRSDDWTGPENNVRCALDTGHEGAHDPVPLEPKED
jgi:hypothetical protein